MLDNPTPSCYLSPGTQTQTILSAPMAGPPNPRVMSCVPTHDRGAPNSAKAIGARLFS